MPRSRNSASSSRRGPAAHRAGHRQAAHRLGAVRTGRHRHPGACRRSTSRCGTSAARRSAIPLARLLGGLRDRVPAYASGALMRTTPLDKTRARRGGAGREGLPSDQDPDGGRRPDARAGDRAHPRDPRRGRPDIALMVDINQRWSVHEAISIGAPDRGLRPRLARGPDRADRLSGARRDRGRAHDAGLRRRISLRHRAAPAVARRIIRSTSS